MTTRRDLSVVGVILMACCLCPWHARGEQACRVVQQGKQVDLCSPSLVFHLDITKGLHAASLENRLTGKSISLGNGPELEFDIGLPGKALQTPKLEVSKVEVKGQGETGEVVFQLVAKEPAASAVVAYRWDARQPVLHKFVQIVNQGTREWNRLLNVRLGEYRTQAKPSGAGWQGFPVYLDEECFLSLAHPAGWAVAEKGGVQLRHHPGAKLSAGRSFECMETVYGVAPAGQARKKFIAHVESRMRRVQRGHDKSYAIFEPFGARPNGSFDETEEFVLDMIAKVAQGQRESGCRFDYFSIDFWVDFHGDLKKCDPKRFPNGLTRITEELKKIGVAPGLWIDSGGFGGGAWSIGGNPVVKECFAREPIERSGLCRASEPVKSMYTEAFRYHIRENGVRLLKFDNLLNHCNNPKHAHLPGVYSTEAIHNALIEFLHALDAECPDVFLMLYWGYRSPWWLLHGDTYFDSGIGIEAASPSDQPAPYVRDSITQKLDQAQWKANEDVSPLGKDSLGVWLSDWPWNSQVGKERWEGGFILDLCRGSLLAQPWSDTPWLSPPERKQMAEFLALLKAQPGCFRNSRPILGDPRKNEAYGYCCTDGKRAFLAIHNCCWKDSVVKLELDSAWGLPDRQAWVLYRWYPDPAKLAGSQASFGTTASIALRPFEIVLLEAVPHGQAPSLDRGFESKPIPAAFAEPSRVLDLVVERDSKETQREDQAAWTLLQPAEFASSGGTTLRKLPDGSILASGKNPASDTYTITAETDLSGITGLRLEVLPDPTLPGGGPGRAVNGNFALSEFRVTASPRSGQGDATVLKLRNPSADFSQRTHGGWPVAATLDNAVHTAWSIDPLEGKPHVAIFDTGRPVGFSGGTKLKFMLQHGAQADHNIGRLRLSATTARRPAPPKPASQSLSIKGQVPASTSGGLLVVSVEMASGGKPMLLGGPGKFLTAQGTLAGQTVTWKPVVGTATYPSCWQAWRIAVEPSSQARPFELTIAAGFASDVQLTPKGHFVPR